MRIESVVSLAGALLALAAGVSADPRWWTHDRALTVGPALKAHPDVVLPGYVPGGKGPIVVVWDQQDAGGDRNVWLLLSMDHGCTWCPPKLWAGAAGVDETRPRVELGINPTNKMLIHVVYERESQAWVTATDSLDAQSPGICLDLASLTPVTTLLSRPLAVGDLDSSPRIARASRLGNRFDLYAAWNRAQASGASSLEFSSNLLFGAANTWTSPGRDLTGEIGGQAVLADIAADNVGGPGDRSAVTLFYLDPVSSHLKLSRNTQQGQPLGWSTTDLDLSAKTPSLLAAESSTSNFGETKVWNGVLWLDAATSEARFDAAFWTDPSSRAPDFEAADELASAPSEAALGAALAVGAPNLTDPARIFAFWARDQAPAQPEIFSRGGIADSTVPVNHLQPFPIPAARVAPPDPALAVVGQLSLCSWDELTGACVPQARPATSLGASQVSAAEGGTPLVFATVFIDDRSGDPQVYLKTTDESVGAPFPIVTTACEGLRTAQAQVSFDLLSECPAASFNPEYLERYFIYYDKNGAGGPYAQRQVIASWSPPGPIVRQFPGLEAGQSYSFVVIAEDQARNISPAGFDPAANTNSAPQTVTRATPPCTPVVGVPSCAYLGARCNPGDPWDASRDPRPGETAELTIHLANTGDWPATGLAGTVTVTNATVLSPPQGDLSQAAIPAIPAGGAADVTVVVRIDATLCPSSVEVSVPNLSSESGLVTYGPASCAKPFLQITDCTTTCVPACASTNLNSLGNSLRSVKQGVPAAGITFSWVEPLDGAVEYHVNAVPTKDSIPQANLPGTGSGVAACAAVAPAVSCTDADGLATGGAGVFHQAMSACGPLGEDEGPF